MSLKDEITEKVHDYLGAKYEITTGRVIPDKSGVGFGAVAKELEHVVVMYVDLRASREILSKNTALIAARAHKSFLFSASKCIRNQDGYLRSFNGDSVLALFIGDKAATRAVKAAMKINGAVSGIINPILTEKGIKKLDFGVGIGQGDVLVVKSGVYGDEMHQDLLWIGWPTYHAFEYGDMASNPKNIWISKNVYSSLDKQASGLIKDKNGDLIWVYNDGHHFSFGNVRVYKTSYLINL